MHKQARGVPCAQRHCGRVLCRSPQAGGLAQPVSSAVSDPMALPWDSLHSQANEQPLQGEQVRATLSFISSFAARQSFRSMESRSKHGSEERIFRLKPRAFSL